MSPLSKQEYPQDKQSGGPPPVYPNQAYHPPSERRRTVVKKKRMKMCSYHFRPDPPHKSGQYQPQPHPQVIYVERREGRGNDAVLPCATAWSVFFVHCCPQR